MDRYVIIGNGVAGVSAARRIRELDGEGHIDVVTRESYAFYSRPMLPRVIAEQVREEDVIIYSPDWYRKNNISVVLNDEVVDVNREEKEVKSAGGHAYRYDRLLIATGSSSFVPPIKGVDKKGVFTLRSLSDCRQIHDYARNARSAVLIGGGVLGMEAAAALTKFGIKVSVVEALPWLLPRQMDMASAEILKKQLEEKMGFTFYLNSQTREIVGNGQTQGVLLASGEKLLADLVLISAGVRPNTGLAQKIGLKVNRGIVVDDHLETSIKDIFAAGDVAEHRGVVYGLWSVAQKQGEIVGANMTGHNETYTGSPPANTLMVLGINLVSAGEIDSEGKYSSITKKDNIHNTYRKLVLKDDVIIGCILLNDIRGSQEILQSIEKKRDVKPFKDMLLDDNFDFRRLT